MNAQTRVSASREFETPFTGTVSLLYCDFNPKTRNNKYRVSIIGTSHDRPSAAYATARDTAVQLIGALKEIIAEIDREDT